MSPEACRALVRAGAPEEEARAAAATAPALDNVATKTEIAELRADMYLRLWLMAVGIVTATAALVKLVP